MSIMRCEKHDRNWDSDKLDDCPLCENEPIEEPTLTNQTGTRMTTWKKTGGISGNEVLDADGFFISYMPARGMAAFSFFNSDQGSDETALVVQGDGRNQYFILNGDFRKDYEKAAKKGLKACMAFYKSKKDTHNSSWSTESEPA